MNTLEKKDKVMNGIGMNDIGMNDNEMEAIDNIINNRINTIINYGPDGLIPCIVVDSETKEVLMLAYMNQEALEITLETKQMTYYSRSRKKLWVKGETSGNRQQLIDLRLDCDQDSLVAIVVQTGPACHNGTHTCFQESLYKDTNYYKILTNSITRTGWENLEIIKSLSDTISKRRLNPVAGSYTNYLLDKGIDKILKKIGEEATETIIGAKNTPEEMVSETADLLYHLLVLYENQGVEFTRVLDTLRGRSLGLQSLG